MIKKNIANLINKMKIQIYQMRMKNFGQTRELYITSEEERTPRSTLTYRHPSTTL